MGYNGELGDFLRSRRPLLTPNTAGLPLGAGRAGCPSREEVAPLACVTTRYTCLEQGRHPHLSEAVPPSPTPCVSTTNAATSSSSPAPRPTAP